MDFTGVITQPGQKKKRAEPPPIPNRPIASHPEKPTKVKLKKSFAAGLLAFETISLTWLRDENVKIYYLKWWVWGGDEKPWFLSVKSPLKKKRIQVSLQNFEIHGTGNLYSPRAYQDGMIPSESQKKTALLSRKYWFVDRDPVIMVYEIIPT